MGPEDLLGLLGLAAVGVASAFVNTLAGGGSLLTLPVLMLFGLPVEVANGTNRVAVFLQSALGARDFDRQGRLDRAGALPVVAPTLVGSLAGALTASWLPRHLLKPLLVGSLVLVALTLLRPPKAATQPDASRLAPEPVRAKQSLLLLAVGVYGGFVQAGVGFFLLALLGSVLRYDLVRANALKVVAVAAFTGVALGVFAWRGQVDWLIGAVLACGSMVGARLGVRFAVSTSERALRRLVVAAVIVASVAALLRY